MKKDGTKIVIEDTAHEELLKALGVKEGDDPSFDSKNSGASRRSNFSSSTGNCTNRSVSSSRLARDQKDRALQNAQLAGSNVNLANQNSLLEARLTEMTLLLQNKDCPTPQSGRG